MTDFKRFAWLGVAPLILGIVAAYLWIHSPVGIDPSTPSVADYNPSRDREPIPMRSVTKAVMATNRIGGQPANVWLLPESATNVGMLNAEGRTAEQDIEILQNLLRLYRRANESGNPVGGSHEQVISQLLGRNPKKLALLPPDLPCLDSSGRLLDRWGAPYFFHALSNEQMEIRSPGPDGIIFTEDDIASF